MCEGCGEGREELVGLEFTEPQLHVYKQYLKQIMVANSHYQPR